MTTGQQLTIRDLMDRQAAEGAYTATVAETVRQAAVAIQTHGVSAITVVDADGVLIGILSEKDISHLVAEGGDPDTVTVGEAMTKNPITVNLGTSLGKTAQDMIKFNIRHLPVVDGGRPVSTVSIRDVLSLLIDQLQSENEQLRADMDWLGFMQGR